MAAPSVQGTQPRRGVGGCALTPNDRHSACIVYLYDAHPPSCARRACRQALEQNLKLPHCHMCTCAVQAVKHGVCNSWQLQLPRLCVARAHERAVLVYAAVFCENTMPFRL
jgi:hypothetical protein